MNYDIYQTFNDKLRDVIDLFMYALVRNCLYVYAGKQKYK